ncbi:MAG TPA: hypothetical protein VE464_06470 [Streptosporangiaceae bacterium]|nr:hypothetical protein [Streptosporangiaceae bacterium]
MTSPILDQSVPGIVVLMICGDSSDVVGGPGHELLEMTEFT